MIVSYSWLQKYFEQKLPSADKIADKLIFHSFEVEDVQNLGDDTISEIKVLPDRAHDCLSHFGIAKEIGALFDLPVKKPKEFVKDIDISKTERNLSIQIEDEKLCRRYVGRVVEGVKIKESPEWLKNKLENVGQRSINNIVDISNYVMFDVGEPLHAFDADKVKGNIVVRSAKTGEKIEVLDGRVIELDESVLVIADDEGPIAIAGIKGGKRAEIDENTKNVILEAANFHPVLTRKSSFKTGIRTDGSKRWENELSTEVADYAMDLFTTLVNDLAGTEQTKIGEKIDEYKVKNIPEPIEFSFQAIKTILGVDISVSEATDILKRLGIEVEERGEKLFVKPPVERLDLVIKENYIEEIGRIFGYEKIAGQLPSKMEEKKDDSEAEKRWRVANKIRETLKGLGFSEVYGYAFTDHGFWELANPLASDKGYLRDNLTDWLTEKIKVNLPYVLFDNEAVKIFEIGTVFNNDKEEIRLGLGVGYRKKIKGKDVELEITETVEKLKQTIGWVGDLSLATTTQSVDKLLSLVEINFEKLVDMAGPFNSTNLENLLNLTAKYQPISFYPRIIRDIAIWVPEQTKMEEIEKEIKDNAGPLLVIGPIVFDEFIKDGKKSLAFRLVFQSYERTLLDEEINEQMVKVIESLERNEGFEVRK